MSLFDTIIFYYESITPFQASMLLSFMLLYVLYLFLRDMGVPPGPKGVPLFGYWPFLKPDTCHLQLQELSKQYGDVYSLRITGTLHIHLGSIKYIKEAIITKSENFAGRYSDSIVALFSDGVAFVNGEQWKVLRKFFVPKFKEYGMSTVKENAASSVYDALTDTVEELHSTEGRPVHITDLITMRCMMIMRRILFNDQGIKVEEVQELIDLFTKMMTGLTNTNLLLIGKFARYCMFPLMPAVRMVNKCSSRIDAILSDVIERHKSEYNESHVADLIDCYFKERDEKRRRGDPAAQYMTDKVLMKSLSQFLTDGVLSVGTFIGNFLMTLVEHPEEQDKIYEEILEVVGPDRTPTLEDKSKLPYTNAFINEVSRFTDFFPLFPSMECTKETTVQGYKIPAGSVALLNLYAAHRNPSDFENPDEFNPSRYLTTPDRPRAELPILFGVGKRSCLGEPFAMIQIFLFLTTIVQNFRLSIAEGSVGPSLVYSSAEKLAICVHPRPEKSNSK